MTYEEYKRKKYNNENAEQSSSQTNVSDNRYSNWKESQNTSTQNKQWSNYVTLDNDNRYEKWKETQRQLELERKQQEEQRAKEEAERKAREEAEKKAKEQSEKNTTEVKKSEHKIGSTFRDVVEDNEAQNQNNSKDSKLEQILNDNSRNMRPKNAEEFGNGIQKGGDAVADLGYKAVEDVSGIIDNILLGATRGIKKAGDFAWNSGQSHARNAEERQKLIEEESKKLLKNRDDYDENYSPVNDFIPEDSPLQSLMSEAKDFKSTIEDTSKNIDKDIDTKINENIEKASDPVTKKILEISPSVGQMIPGVAGGGTPYLFTSAAGSYYDEGIQRGMSEDEALRYSGIMAGMETATESIQLGKVFKAGTKVTTGSVKSALKDYGLNLADNFIQEAIMEPISETSATVVAGSDKADWSNMPSRMLKEGVDGALVAVIMDGSTAGISSAKQVQQKIEHNETVTPEEIKQAVEDVQKSGKVDIENIVQREMQYQANKYKSTIDISEDTKTSSVDTNNLINTNKTQYENVERNEAQTTENQEEIDRTLNQIYNESYNSANNNQDYDSQKVLYHGSQNIIDGQYNTQQGRKNRNTYGEATYLTEDKEYAKHYGENISENVLKSDANIINLNEKIELTTSDLNRIANVLKSNNISATVEDNYIMSEDLGILDPGQNFYKNMIRGLKKENSQKIQSIMKQLGVDAIYVPDTGTYAIYNQDIIMKKNNQNPLQNNIETKQSDTELIDSLEKEQAPAKSGLTTQEQQEKMMFDMYVQEKGYDSMDEDSKKRYEYLKSQVEENVANVLEDNTEVDSPLDDRNINDVGNRNVKAYEYINPEVKPFFQREADNMLGDLRDTIPAERYKIGNDDGYDSSKWEGTSRATVKAIAELKDDFGYSYDQIKKGLEAIKQDHGSENNAVSKRIEFKLDERLREGYITVEGYPIPPNQEYINFLQEKEIHDYNKEAFESLRDEDYTENADTNLQQNHEQINNQINEKERITKIKELYKQQHTAQKEVAKLNRNINLTDEEDGIVKGLLSNNITIKDIPNRFDNSRVKIIQKYENSKKLYEINKQIQEHKKASKKVYDDLAQKIVNSKGKIKDKSKGIFYRRETFDRNIQDIVKDKELAQDIIDTYFRPEQKNEAERIRFINNNAEKIKNLKIDTKAKYEYTNHIINKKGEYEYKKIKINEADVAGLYLEKKVGDVFFEKNKINKSRIQEISNTFKSILDDSVNLMEEQFIKAGYSPIGRIENYFPHFYESKPDGLIGKLTHFIGIRTKTQNLPTEIAGITDTFKPGKTWNANTLHRQGDITDINALKAMEKYITSASDVIYHTDDIQKLRALEKNIRKSYSDEETLKTIQNISNSTEMTEVEKEEAISNKLKNIKTELPNFVTWLNEYTNVLANKKAKSDRTMEENWGRGAYITMQDVESKIASNIVGGNLSVSLTNFAPLAQAMGTTKVGNVLVGMMETVKNDINTLKGDDDGFSEASDFLVRRRGAEIIHKKSKTEKTGGILGKPMELIDNFTSESIVRAKYRENIQKGMSEIEAMKNADEYAAHLMADRSKGSQPTLFESKNPVNKLITMFQVEPNNMLSNYTKDWRNYSGNKAFAVVKLSVASYGFNTILKSIRGGSDILPDPIHIVSSLIKMFTSDDDKDKKSAEDDIISSLTGSLPFGTTAVVILNTLGIDVPDSIENSGKMPVANAIPSIGNIIKGVKSDSEEYRNQQLGKELMKPILYLGLPTGGAQISKTVKGVKSYLDGESYKYNSKGEKQLQFTVDEKASNLIRSIIFGKYSLKEAQDYVDSGYKTIDADKIEEMKKLKMNSTEYREYSSILSNWRKLYSKKKEIEKSSELSSTEQAEQLRNINTQIKDIETNRLVNYKHIKQYSNYLAIGDEEYYRNAKGYWTKIDDDFSKDLKELKLTVSEKDKYFNTKHNLDLALNKYKEDVKGISIEDDESKEYKDIKGNLSSDKKEYLVNKVINSGLNNDAKVYLYKKYYNDETIDKIVESKINVDDYLKYTTKEFTSDKDSKGKTISNSRKKKVVQYVNTLDLSIAQKAILIKTTNTFKFNDYNYQVVDYVEKLGLPELERKQLYRKLDMTLNSNGTVSWKE